MDASQYKDYVLVMLFVKYISDKYAGVPYAPITIPKGASVADLVALKGKARQIKQGMMQNLLTGKVRLT
jgi:type I restriction enzyme M protein